MMGRQIERPGLQPNGTGRHVRTDFDELGFLDQVRDLATDVINQGGIQNMRTIRNAE